ncbi:MAG TPA: DUF2946 family protein [Pyrinomonadaceae bacterium]
MTSKTRPTSSFPQAPFARLLALALLVFIAYGATAEAAHKHCNLPSGRAAGAAASIGKSGDEDSSQTLARSAAECLICQLHQHLFVNLFSALPQLAAPPVLALKAPADAISQLGRTDAPRRGRAPPFRLSVLSHTLKPTL